MYLASMQVRRLENTNEATRAAQVSSGTAGNVIKQINEKIELWKNCPIDVKFPDCAWAAPFFQHSRAGVAKTASILVATDFTADGYQEVLGATEVPKEDNVGLERLHAEETLLLADAPLRQIVGTKRSP